MTNLRLHSSMSIFRRVARLIVRFILPTAKSQLHLTGPYSSYEAALAHSSGYASPLILAKVKQAVVEVLEGLAVYERDGTVFSSLPKGLKLRELLYKYLSPTAHVVDFGGGLGSTFINHRDLVLVGQHWSIIEQPAFVKAGQELAKAYSLPLEFHNNLFELSSLVDLFILSSVLPYLSSPYDIIKQVLELAPKFIIIDRTAFIDRGEEAWWLQDCSDYFGPSVAIPIQPLHLTKLFNSLPGYILVEKWVNFFDAADPSHFGLLFERN
jgi:putative methyltransferase (TIGR04325 family)